MTLARIFCDPTNDLTDGTESESATAKAMACLRAPETRRGLELDNRSVGKSTRASAKTRSLPHSKADT